MAGACSLSAAEASTFLALSSEAQVPVPVSQTRDGALLACKHVLQPLVQKEMSLFEDAPSRDPEPTSEIATLRKDLRVARDALEASQRGERHLRSLLVTKDAEITTKNTEIATKDAEIAALRRELVGTKYADVSVHLTGLPSAAAPNFGSPDSTTHPLPVDSPNDVADDASEVGGGDGVHLMGGRSYVALDLPAGQSTVDGPTVPSLPNLAAAAATSCPAPLACPPAANSVAGTLALSRPDASTAAAADPASPSRFRIRALFASPLAAYYSDLKPREPMCPLDFLAEERLLSNAIAKGRAEAKNSNLAARRRIRLVSGILTVDTLMQALLDGCDVLHVSTHADEGHLATECGHGMQFPLSLDMLVKLLATSDGGGILRADGSPRIRLVVLSACKSRAMADALHNAGVPYVICVNGATNVLETTCLAFMEALYDRLASGASVRSAFNAACTVAAISSGSLTPFELLLSASRALADDNSAFFKFSDGLTVDQASGASAAMPVAPAVLTLSRQSSAPHNHVNLPPPRHVPTVEAEEVELEEFEDEAMQASAAAELETPHGPDQQPDGSEDVTIPPLTTCLARALSFGDPGTPATPSASDGAGDSTEHCRSPMPVCCNAAGDSLAGLTQHLPAVPPVHLCLSRGLLVSQVVEDVMCSRLVVLTGPEGSGKSFEALRVAHWLALRDGGHPVPWLGGRCCPDGVFYVDAATTRQMYSAPALLLQILRAVSPVPVSPAVAAETEMAAVRTRTAEAESRESPGSAASHAGRIRLRIAAAIGVRRCLLVLDGLDGCSEQGAFMKWPPPAVEDVAHGHEPITAEWIREDLLPHLLGNSHGLRILVTRRESLGGAFDLPVRCLDAFLPRRIIMPPLTTAEALLLFKQRQSATMAEGEESAHAKLLMYRDPLLPAGVIAAVRAASAAAARDAMS